MTAETCKRRAIAPQNQRIYDLTPKAWEDPHENG